MELPSDHPDRAALVYTKANKNGERPVESVFDPAVYHRKSSLRVLYNHKLGRQVCAVPAFDSSPDVIAHLVCVDTESFTPPQMTPPLKLKLKLKPNSTVAPRTTISNRRITDTTPAPSRSPPTPTWQPSYSNELLGLIREHEGIRSTLGDEPVVFRGITTNPDGAGDTCCIPISSRATCPYANRVHSSNHLYLLYTHSTHIVSLRCHNSVCKKRTGFHAWHVDVVTPDDASITPSLHSCEHLVQYEDYHKPTMDEFPTDASIAVIVGAMGMGE